MEHIYLARIKKLTIYLMISGALNCFALATLIFYYTKDRPPTPYYALKPVEKGEQEAPLASDETNFEVIYKLKKLSFEQLLGLLTHTTLIDNGYTQRDMALACMVAFHDFDLKRALGPQWMGIQKRALVYGKQVEKIIVFPGISEDQFQNIIQFANTEQWPFTPRGIFKLLQTNTDPQLAEMFFLTPEFLAVELLFNRSDVSVDKHELLQLIKEGDWNLLTQFVQQQKISQDLSPARRQRLLLDYLKQPSKTAAYLLLKVDGDFATRKLDDGNVLAMLDLMVDRTPTSEKFAIDILKSPRRDDVLQKAGMRLYDYLGEPQPEKFDPQALLARFLPDYKPPVKPKPVTKAPPVAVKAIKKEKLYVVQEGDSLWKIAKKFKVDIETLKTYNKLKTDFLKPGSTLKIP